MQSFHQNRVLLSMSQSGLPPSNAGVVAEAVIAILSSRAVGCKAEVGAEASLDTTVHKALRIPRNASQSHLKA